MSSRGLLLFRILSVLAFLFTSKLHFNILLSRLQYSYRTKSITVLQLSLQLDSFLRPALVNQPHPRIAGTVVLDMPEPFGLPSSVSTPSSSSVIAPVDQKAVTMDAPIFSDVLYSKVLAFETISSSQTFSGSLTRDNTLRRGRCSGIKQENVQFLDSKAFKKFEMVFKCIKHLCNMFFSVSNVLSPAFRVSSSQHEQRCGLLRKGFYFLLIFYM